MVVDLKCFDASLSWLIYKIMILQHLNGVNTAIHYTLYKCFLPLVQTVMRLMQKETKRLLKLNYGEICKASSAPASSMRWCGVVMRAWKCAVKPGRIIDNGKMWVSPTRRASARSVVLSDGCMPFLSGDAWLRHVSSLSRVQG